MKYRKAYVDPFRITLPLSKKIEIYTICRVTDRSTLLSHVYLKRLSSPHYDRHLALKGGIRQIIQFISTIPSTIYRSVVQQDVVITSRASISNCIFLLKWYRAPPLPLQHVNRSRNTIACFGVLAQSLVVMNLQIRYVTQETLALGQSPAPWQPNGSRQNIREPTPSSYPPIPLARRSPVLDTLARRLQCPIEDVGLLLTDRVWLQCELL